MDELEGVRRKYAQRIRDVLWRCHRVRLSDDLVSAFARIPREAFLGPAPWLVRGAPPATAWQRLTSRLAPRRYSSRDWSTRDPHQLYRDVAVAIDAARGLNNGQPSGLALWIQLLDLRRGDRVLHIGCGLGYYTALMAALVAPGEVIGVEIDATLARLARANLASVDSVFVVNGDGAHHDPGPVDAILVNAGVTHPQTLWLDRLRPGGRMLLPLTNHEGIGMMLKVTSQPAGYAARFVSKLLIFHCAGARDVQYSERLASQLAGNAWRSVQSLRRDSHSPDAECWFHGQEFCLSARPIG